MRSILVILLLAVGSSELLAQRLEAAAFERDAVAGAIQPLRLTSDAPQPKTTDMVVGGLAGALFLGAAGGFMGYSAVKGCQEFLCDLGGILLGTTLGEVVGLPLGVRAAGGKGSVAEHVLISAAVFASGAFAAPITYGLSLLAVIPVQLHFVVNRAKGAPASSEAPR